MRSLVTLILFTFTLLVLPMQVWAKPNILLVLADDLGYADVGFNGAKDIRTPNLDRLAQAGVRFTDAYVAHPFCGPSRAAIMTGRYPHKFGAQFNLPVRGSSVGVPLSEKFIAQTLREAGYFTGAIGKWHLGEAAQYHPNQRGFDEFYGFLGGGHQYFPSQFKPAYEAQRKQDLRMISHYLTPLEHNGKAVDEQEYITDALSREAVNFIRMAKQKSQPFFLYLAYNAPHTPLQAKQEDMARFSDIKDTKRRTYAGMVYALDRGVGTIVDALRQTGQLDNTLIVFLSDNGGRPDQGADNRPLREGKGSVYEGGFRVPMFMFWPAQLRAASEYHYPVQALDLYPSFAAIAGADISRQQQLDGINILPAVRTHTDAHGQRPIYVLRHYADYSNAAVRRGHWKAVKYGDKPWALFDIERDIAETRDLSREQPRLLRDMVYEMETWSWDNQQPHWFHESAEADSWRRNAMPQFGKTFAVP